MFSPTEIDRDTVVSIYLKDTNDETVYGNVHSYSATTNKGEPILKYYRKDVMNTIRRYKEELGTTHRRMRFGGRENDEIVPITHIEVKVFRLDKTEVIK